MKYRLVNPITDEILECDNLKTLFKHVSFEIRYDYRDLGLWSVVFFRLYVRRGNDYDLFMTVQSNGYEALFWRGAEIVYTMPLFARHKLDGGAY